jgi:hypothetical protein
VAQQKRDEKINKKTNVSEFAPQPVNLEKRKEFSDQWMFSTYQHEKIFLSPYFTPRPHTQFFISKKRWKQGYQIWRIFGDYLI